MSKVRFERRQSNPTWSVRIASLLLGVAAGLGLSAVLLIATGRNPVAVFREMVQASIGGPVAISHTLAAATPLVFTGLAAAVAFRSKLWNIGGEGQLFIGALIATGVGISLEGRAIQLTLPAMVMAGVLGGMLWGLVPALLRVALRTNEILTTLMFNYIAGLLIYYLIFSSHSYWREWSTPESRIFPQSKILDEGSYWPMFTIAHVQVPSGFLLGIACALILYAVLWITRMGFAVRVTAESAAVAHYAGIKIRYVMLAVFLVSAGLAGLAGASQVGDFSHRLDPQGLQLAGLGYLGIAAACLARLSLIGVVPCALFLGGLNNAGFELQGASFPQGLVGVITALILLSTLCGEVWVRYRFTVRGGPTPITEREEARLEPFSPTGQITREEGFR